MQDRLKFFFWWGGDEKFMVEFFLCFWDFTCFSGLELDSLGLGVPVMPLLGVRGPQTKPSARLHQGLGVQGFRGGSQ